MINTNDILQQFGLQTRKGIKDYVAPALGILGAGAVVGAGLSLLLAPKSGKELRGDIRDKAVGIRDGATRLKDRVTDRLSKGPHLAEMSREQLYEEAREHDISGRSDMTKQELLDAVQSA
jgi:gas vesicle protein